MRILENSEWKRLESKDFNFIFNKKTGYTETWGRTRDDDPEFCQYGPLIADIEISTICQSTKCAYCYKDNTDIGENMSFDTFKTIFHKFPRTLTQIAFGIGNINSSPDLKKIFDYCRNNDYQYIVPNVTINGFGMTSEWYDYLAMTCGAVAVSRHHEDSCFNAVKELTDRGMTQVNIHQVVSLQTFDTCMDMIDKVQTDSRLEKLNAVVFLMLKKKGRGVNLNRLSDDKYKLFVDKLFASGISFGMDSCGSGRLLNYGVSKEIEQYITPCESTRESSYINVKGEFFPCSFTEGTDSFPIGIDVTKITNFVEEVWMAKETNEWRKNLISKCFNCPVYKI